MRASKNKQDPHELSPAFLPEFGLSVSWAMRRNPACRHFGLPYLGPSLTDKKAVSDHCYRIEAATGRIRCKCCGMSFQLKSNKAIRPLARYFLELNQPLSESPSLHNRKPSLASDSP